MTQAVVSRAKKGDEAAVEVVWRAYQPGLLRYLRSLGTEGAEDVASVVWVELANAFPTLRDDDPTSVRRMLFTIARRRMIDEFRRRERRPEIMSGEIFDAEAAPEESLAGAVELLSMLPPSQAEVIALRTIAGMSSQEVGEITGQTAAAVRVMAHRGLQALREILTAKGIGPDGVGRTPHQRPRPVTKLPVPANNQMK